MAINTKQPGDYGYIGFYKGQRVEVYTGKGTYEAQKLIAAHLNVKPKDQYKISVNVAERPDGADVIHTAVD